MSNYTSRFVTESNLIEGIHRKCTLEEMEAHEEFINLEQVTVGDLIDFVRVYQPDAQFRGSRDVSNVIIGGRLGAASGVMVKGLLSDLTSDANEGSVTPFMLHKRYEIIHPFTDGNGRSGRVLWAWYMDKLGKNRDLGFLHTYYYQSLAEK